MLQKLGSATDTRERVLDLVRQQRRHGRDRPRGIAVPHLLTDADGERLLHQRQHHPSHALGDWRCLNRNGAQAGARAIERDAMLGDAVVLVADHLDQPDNGAVFRQEFGQRVAAQAIGTQMKELFHGRIDLPDDTLVVDHHDGGRQSVQDRGRIQRLGVAAAFGRVLQHVQFDHQAAAFCSSPAAA